MSEIERALSDVTAHADYERIDYDEYAALGDDGPPIYELQKDGRAGGYRADITPVADSGDFVAFVSGGAGNIPIKYRLTPSDDIEESLRVLEQADEMSVEELLARLDDADY